MSKHSKTPKPWEHPEAAAWLAYADVRQAEGAGREELIDIRTTGMALLEPRELVLLCDAQLSHDSFVGGHYRTSVVVWPHFEAKSIVDYDLIQECGISIMRIRWVLRVTLWNWELLRLVLGAIVFPENRAKQCDLYLPRKLLDRSPPHKPTDFPWLYKQDGRPANWPLVCGWYNAQKARMRKARRECVSQQARMMSQMEFPNAEEESCNRPISADPA